MLNKIEEHRTHVYAREFFDYVDVGSRRSAARVVTLMSTMMKPNSVLDVGCGTGAWLAEWLGTGLSDCIGLDGTYISRDQLVIPSDRFVPTELSKPFNLGRSFGLVQSLEVAEHVARESADTFVANLCAHGQIILFSAAVPGQGGEMHVNEQPLEYWRSKFYNHGYEPFDCVRPQIFGDRLIEPWYRYNCLLYVHANVMQSLPAKVLKTFVSRSVSIPELAPLSWRLRKTVLRCLPQRSTTWLAVVKHRVYNKLRR